MDGNILLKGLRVLLVEDDPASRDILKTFLNELGVTDIEEKVNGADAFEFVKANPDWQGVILCDWNMPVMSGSTFHRAVREIHPDIPFIMITGRNDESSVMFAKDNGIYAYIIKPIPLEELEKKLLRVVGNNVSFLTEPANTTADNKALSAAHIS